MDLSKGGFLATIPSGIGTKDEGFSPKMAGLPENIVYSYIHPNGFAVAHYEPSLGTFCETGVTKEMTYLNVQGGPYSVKVRLNKISGAMETIKFRGEKVVCIAEGPDFDSAMLQTTMMVLQADEPVTLHDVRTTQPRRNGRGSE